MMNNKTRCLIVEDEPLAVKLIKTHLSKLESFEVAGECRNALRALDFMREEKVDLIFLDINMPELTGLDFLKTLPDPPYVIITTAFREYAVEGYDLDVVDFLLKPISFERFLKAINRYYTRIRATDTKTGITGTDMKDEKQIYVQDGKNIFRLACDDIICIKGFGEYVKVITPGRNYVVRDSLTEFEHKLPPVSFLRIHKSYIVNIQKVTGFNTVHVLLRNSELPIGRIYREKAMKVLKGDTGA